ncbi:hypothetical protein M409DRAFT_71053 [Zasmidium cellare ATCC 36951]|uniref:F-box domain-containing protein n=1 Tax=Zasmidium cellare ATCC 36951 TaxID=1080233 RepID=A0A6A6BXQ5_ZASCE|nr:uncharacterized protein M409DRAFT_71053 [Zasmidium cellare ATCC 36951]KAF2159383.1 hypothetical protein M409DRAFT_71053 [Zasmidium cellare ATCC 36951]
METSRPKTNLTDLPPELLNHITGYLPTASSIASLDRTSRSLHEFVEKNAWKTFTQTRFPSTWPQQSPSYKDTARSLTTLSKAWEKRAFVGRYTEPRGDITAFPGGKHIDRWKRPRGQTIGFTPQLDVYEEVGGTWRDRTEILAFSAGAEVCIRRTKRQHDGTEIVKWTTYRPHSAAEGKDDITALHLVRKSEDDHQGLLTGTANGDLQLLSIPRAGSSGQDLSISYFATNGLPVRSTSLLQDDNHPLLLAANLGEARLALYSVDPGQPKTTASSQVDIQPPLRADGNPASTHRAWVTSFLSPSRLGVGVGPSEDPIHIYTIDGAGLYPKALRKFSLQNDFEKSFPQQKTTSSAYTIVPLPSTVGSTGDGNVFLSGAYDGIIRLHDMRSNRDVEQTYAADDSPIYSLLPRGREKLVAGTSRHNLLKVFDMRLGAKCYSYLDASPAAAGDPGIIDLEKDFNVFLRPNNSSFTVRGSNNWSQGRNRPTESSVYSLASPSAHSPYIYAGVENAIMSLAFTEILDPRPDPVFFEPWSAQAESRPGFNTRVIQSKEVLGLAMYEQGANMKLCVQRSPWETWRANPQGRRNRREQGRLDERWKGAAEFGS